MPRRRHVLGDYILRAEAARIRAPGVPSRARNIGGDSPPGSHYGPSDSRSIASRPPSFQEDEHVADPAVAKTLRDPDVSYLNVLLGATTLEGRNDTSPPSKPSSRGSPISVRRPNSWYLEFYIRTDHQGFFHTYPHLGGPFPSLQKAEDAITRHLHDLEDPKMSKESLAKLSPMESALRQSLYWPDGTMKDPSKQPAGAIDQTRLFVQALLDQYNNGHNLLGDLAYELKDVLHDQYFVCDSDDRYFHYNFTTKVKGADDLDSSINLFFAEVKLMQGEHQEMVPTCLCIVKPDDNGHCYGCKDNRRVVMKHPNMADAYSGGHVDGYLPLGGYYTVQNDYEEDLKVKEKRLRRMYEGIDDPGFIQEIFSNCFATMEDEARYMEEWKEDCMSGMEGDSKLTAKAGDGSVKKDGGATSSSAQVMVQQGAYGQGMGFMQPQYHNGDVSN